MQERVAGTHIETRCKGERDLYIYIYIERDIGREKERERERDALNGDGMS